MQNSTGMKNFKDKDSPGQRLKTLEEGTVYIDISNDINWPLKSPTFAGETGFEVEEESKTVYKREKRSLKGKGKKEFNEAFAQASAEKTSKGNKGKSFGNKNQSVSLK